MTNYSRKAQSALRESKVNQDKETYTKGFVTIIPAKAGISRSVAPHFRGVLCYSADFVSFALGVFVLAAAFVVFAFAATAVPDNFLIWALKRLL